jgi:hypothetical protein
VESKSVQVSDGEAKVVMEYSDYAEYASFNGVDFFVGSVVQAMAAGYPFDVDFYEITSEGAAQTESSDGAAASYQSVERSTITDNSDYKVLITEERGDFKVNGTICYVSDPTAVLVDKGTVRLAEDELLEQGGESTLTYLIYE